MTTGAPLHAPAELLNNSIVNAIPFLAIRSYVRTKINNQTANYYERDKVLPSAKESYSICRYLPFSLYPLDWLQSPVTKYFSHNPV